MTYVIGEPAIHVVGMEGPVQAFDSETVTIGGHVLPRRINVETGVRYLSMDYPPEPCDHGDDYVVLDEPSAAQAAAEVERDTLIALIRADHDDHHDGLIQFCSHTTCREVTR